MNFLATFLTRVRSLFQKLPVVRMLVRIEARLERIQHSVENVGSKLERIPHSVENLGSKLQSIQHSVENLGSKLESIQHSVENVGSEVSILADLSARLRNVEILLRRVESRLADAPDLRKTFYTPPAETENRSSSVEPHSAVAESLSMDRSIGERGRNASPCPICQCPVSAVFFVKDEHALLICEECRHIRWDPFPSESSLRDYYRSQFSRDHSAYSVQTKNRQYYVSHIQELLQRARRLPKGTRLADFGCSIPVLLQEATRAGFAAAIGVDYCDESSRFGADWQIQIVPPDELDCIPDGSLDIVRFSHTLEHSIDPLTLLAAAVRKTRVGGLVYITQPNFPVFRFGPSTRDLKADTEYPRHLHFFSPISVVELTRRAGLQLDCFFTHQNEEAVVSTYRDMLDDDYAAAKLVHEQAKGDAFFPAFGNYPHYAGENSVLYAFKR